jgi:putative ABC transport system permease protein
VTIGLLLALAANQLIAHVLYGLHAIDPLTFCLATFALIAVAMVASYVPASRASRIDAMAALRAE